MWQTLPFDDLARYQELGQLVGTNWVVVAMIAGAVVGLMIACGSEDNGSAIFGMVLLGFLLVLVTGFLQFEEEHPLRQGLLDYQELTQLRANQALRNSCFILGWASMLVIGAISRGVIMCLDD